MKIISIFILSISSLLLSEDRAVIFNAPPGLNQDGFQISYNEDVSNAVANRFYLSNDYILEGVGLWLKPLQGSTISIQIRNDSSGIPGAVIQEWPLTMFASDSFEEYYLPTVADCVDLPGGQYYWLSLKASIPGSSLVWQFSSLNYYYSLSVNDGIDWSDSMLGNVGATSIRGEQIFTYSPGLPDGDVNEDYTTDVLDVVLTVGYILGNEELTYDQQIIADINRDNSIDIMDIVILVEAVLEGPEVMPDFVLEDINPESEYYGQDIGPSFFEGQVSGYYFGKAG